MIKRLTHVTPVHGGIAVAVLYALFSLIYEPFYLLLAAVISQGARGIGPASTGLFGGGVMLASILLPIWFAVLGFVSGVMIAFVYNLTVRWTGGIKFTLIDVIPVPQPDVAPAYH